MVSVTAPPNRQFVFASNVNYATLEAKYENVTRKDAMRAVGVWGISVLADEDDDYIAINFTNVSHLNLLLSTIEFCVNLLHNA